MQRFFALSKYGRDDEGMRTGQKKLISWAMLRHKKVLALYDYCNRYLNDPDISAGEFRDEFSGRYAEIAEEGNRAAREAEAFRNVMDAANAKSSRDAICGAIRECNRMMLKHRREGFADEAAMKEIRFLAELIVEAYVQEKK